MASPFLSFSPLSQLCYDGCHWLLRSLSPSHSPFPKSADCKQKTRTIEWISREGERLGSDIESFNKHCMSLSPDRGAGQSGNWTLVPFVGRQKHE